VIQATDYVDSVAVLYDHTYMRVNPCLTNRSVIFRLILSIALCTAPVACASAGKQNTAVASVTPALVRPIPFGATNGGVDGTVVHVRTLSDTGPGSLREAIDLPGRRLIVFDVGGVIDLKGRTLSVRAPYVTIAGQTAPDPGITLIRGSLVVETHDVVIQHIAVRPGDGGAAPPRSPWAPDAIGVRRDKSPVFNVLIENCSATWAVDENLSTSGPGDVTAADGVDVTAHDITLRNCLVAEALSKSTHPKGEHSKGTLVHDGVRNVAIIGCLYAHNVERNPRLKGGTRTIIADSIMYNWASAAIGVGVHGNEKDLEPAEAVVVNNLAIAGVAIRGKSLVKGLDPGGRVYLKGNRAPGLKLTDEKVVVLDGPPSWAPAIATGDVMRTLRVAGSRPAKRDPIDTRIIRSVIEGTGAIIDSQEQVGGYPVRPEVKRVAEVPEDLTARRAWLQKLSDELSEDKSIDVAPLLKRLNIE
jgi:hypothetical protein